MALEMISLHISENNYFLHNHRTSTTISFRSAIIGGTLPIFFYKALLRLNANSSVLPEFLRVWKKHQSSKEGAEVTTLIPS